MLIEDLAYSYHGYLERPKAGQLKRESNEYVPREFRLQLPLLPHNYHDNTNFR